VDEVVEDDEERPALGCRQEGFEQRVLQGQGQAIPVVSG
jgi:hypothetical protein